MGRFENHNTYCVHMFLLAGLDSILCSVFFWILYEVIKEIFLDSYEMIRDSCLIITHV